MLKKGKRETKALKASAIQATVIEALLGGPCLVGWTGDPQVGLKAHSAGARGAMPHDLVPARPQPLPSAAKAPQRCRVCRWLMLLLYAAVLHAAAHAAGCRLLPPGLSAGLSAGLSTGLSAGL